MITELRKIKAEPKEVRKLVWLFAAIASIFGGLFYFKGRPGSPYLLSLSAFLFFVGWVSPRWFRWLYFIWMGFAVVIGNIISRVILTLLFYFVITPIGFFYRLFNRPSLKDGKRATYWIPKEGQSENMERYEKQF